MESMLLKNEFQWVSVTGADSLVRCGCDEGAAKLRFTAPPRAWGSLVCVGTGKATVSSDTLRPRTMLAMFGCATRLTLLAVLTVI